MWAEKVGEGGREFYCPSEEEWFHENDYSTRDYMDPDSLSSYETYDGNSVYTDDYCTVTYWCCENCDTIYEEDEPNDWRDSSNWKCGKCDRSYGGEGAEQSAKDCCKEAVPASDETLRALLGPALTVEYGGNTYTGITTSNTTNTF